MAETTITNMVMLTNPETGEVLVIDRVKKYPGIAFPGGPAASSTGIMRTAAGISRISIRRAPFPAR